MKKKTAPKKKDIKKPAKELSDKDLKDVSGGILSTGVVRSRTKLAAEACYISSAYFCL